MAMLGLLFLSCSQTRTLAPLVKGSHGNTKEIEGAISRMIIPKIELQNADIRDAIDQLVTTARNNDPERCGVSVILNLPATGASKPLPRITLKLSRIPLKIALDYITSAADLHWWIEPHAIIISSQRRPLPMITRTYRVSPRELDAAARRVLQLQPEAAITTKVVNDFMEKMGVAIPPGATLTYDRSRKRIVATNTAENLNSIESVLDAIDRP